MLRHDVNFYLRTALSMDELWELLSHPERLRDLGDEARKFVLKNWNRNDVANRYISIIEGRPCQVPLLSPGKYNYVEGSGAPIETISKIYAAYLRKYGPKGLMLGERKGLVESIINMAVGAGGPKMKTIGSND